MNAVKSITKIAAMAAFLAPVAGYAQNGAEFTLGFGGKVAPTYFGSDSYGIGPSGSFSLEHLSIGGVSFGSKDPQFEKLGPSLHGAFNIIGARKAAKDAALTGTNDIKTSIELGMGVGYEAADWRAFADVRYGVVGHKSTVAELGADWKAVSTEKFKLSIGPRVVYGSAKYNSTYFGVTAAEALASGGALTAFAPGAGVASAGVEITGTYRLDDVWGIKGTVRYDRLQGDAGASPIVAKGSRNQATASLMLTRRFSLGF